MGDPTPVTWLPSLTRHGTRGRALAGSQETLRLVPPPPGAAEFPRLHREGVAVSSLNYPPPTPSRVGPSALAFLGPVLLNAQDTQGRGPGRVLVSHSNNKLCL